MVAGMGTGWRGKLNSVTSRGYPMGSERGDETRRRKWLGNRNTETGYEKRWDGILGIDCCEQGKNPDDMNRKSTVYLQLCDESKQKRTVSGWVP